MALFNFRQGIARGQEDGNGNPRFLAKSNGGKFIDLVVSPDPTVLLMAHHDSNYLVAENQPVLKAWGPFTAGHDYWLFWDVDLFTGETTYGHTKKEPITASHRPHGTSNGQHWFDTAKGVMKVKRNNRWRQVVRVFAAKYQNGSTIIFEPFGSQVGISGQQFHAGAILFDINNQPVKHFRRNGRGEFFTTESDLHAQFSRNANFRIESSIIQAIAQESISSFSAIAYTDKNTVSLAKNTDPDHPAIGIASEDMTEGEIRSFITKGYVQNVDWDWSTFDAGTAVFVGPTGELVTNTGTVPSMQQIGIIVDKITLFVDVQPLVEFTDEANVVSIGINRITGNLVANTNMGGGTGSGGVIYPPGFVGLMGYTHTQTTPKDSWTIQHGAETENVTAIVYDVDKTTVIPHEVKVIDANTIVITFGSAMAGKAQLQIFK